MSEPYRYTPQEIKHYLIIGFAGPLLVSTVAFILYGVNCYQFCNYIQGFAKKDPVLTKLWVTLVQVFNSGATLYQVYFNWIYGIEEFTVFSTNKAGTVNGNSVILYSVVVMLTQMFWIVCVDAMRNSNPNLWIISPIAFLSFSSFSVAIAVSALSAAYPQPNGAWPSPTVSILMRVVLGLDLGIDVFILMLMLGHLHRMKKQFSHMRKTFSKLTYIFVSVATLSTCVIIVELIINVPQSGNGNSFLKITLTFAPIISPLYTLSLLSILNARGEFWLGKADPSSIEDESQENEDREAQRPQMNFTNEVYARANDRDSRQLPLRDHAATEPVIDIEREAGSSLEDCDDQRRYSNDGSADQIQSTQIGIQTI